MNTLLLTSNYFLSAIVAMSCLRTRPFKWLDPAWAFLGGYFINYCVRPTLFLIDPELGSVYAGMFDETAIRRGFAGVMFFAMVGLAGFALGNLGFKRQAQGFAAHLPMGQAPDASAARLLSWFSLSFLLAGCAGLYGFVSQAGWSGTLVELLQGQRDAFMLVIFGNGLYMFAMQLSLLGWAIICIRWLTSDLPGKRAARVGRRALQIGWLAVILGIWVAFAERSTILAVVFAPVALRQTIGDRGFTVVHRPAAAKRKGTAVLVLAAACFAVAGPVGLLMKGLEVSPAAAVSMSISAWDSFEFTSIAQNRVRSRDLLLGKSYWEDVVYTWLPRAVFPWKPARYGSVLVQDLVAPELMDREGATFPPGMLVEAFCNFGYVGLFLIPLLIGSVCRAIYDHIVKLDWLWLVLMAISFTNLASFRGFGGFVAILLANGAIAYAVRFAVRHLLSIPMAIGRLQLE